MKLLRAAYALHFNIAGILVFVPLPSVIQGIRRCQHARLYAIAPVIWASWLTVCFSCSFFFFYLSSRTTCWPLSFLRELIIIFLVCSLLPQSPSISDVSLQCWRATERFISLFWHCLEWEPSPLTSDPFNQQLNLWLSGRGRRSSIFLHAEMAASALVKKWVLDLFTMSCKHQCNATNVAHLQAGLTDIIINL